MAEQEALLPGPPTDGGLWRRYLTHGTINHAAWLRARSEGTPVGDCRHCNGRLMPQPPADRAAGGTDYEATCGSCGWTLLAPRGRTMHGSTLWSKSNGAARAAAIHRNAKETP